MREMKKRELTAEESAECRRLKALWNAKKSPLGLTQQKLADAMGGGITQGAVGHYLNGRNALNLTSALAFAKALDVPMQDFSPRLHREIAGQHQAAATASTQAAQFPLLTFAQVADGVFESGFATSPCIRGSEQVFALVVDGDAMTLPLGVHGYSFPAGVTIYAERCSRAERGALVVALTHDKNQALFRKFQREDGQAVLVPLNPNRQEYPIFRGAFDVVARVVSASWGTL